MKMLGLIVVQKIGGAGSNGRGWSCSGGIGNPSGNFSEKNGTGGLLVCYANSIENNGTIDSNGTDCSASAYESGGASGGGSVNIFYKTAINNNGTISAEGGKSHALRSKGGNGGNGTVTIGSIATDIFVKDNL